MEELLADNVRYLVQCGERELPYLLIDEEYKMEPSQLFGKKIQKKEKLG